MQCPKCNGERRRGATYCGECGRRLGAELDVHAGPSSFADGRYMIERRLGEGAHKVVYLARDCRLSRAVALAWFRTEGMDRAARETLEREVGAIARLGEHPNIASIYDLGEEGGRPYLVREYVDGGSVTDVMAAADGGRIDVERAVEIAAGVARALEHAHDHGVLHRDIKPANIWLDASGMVKLGDFGLAGFADHVSLSRSETVLGTVYYVAPEQARGEALDARADLYALGATLYEMLTGRPPFLGDSALAVVSQHLHAEAVAPSWLAPGVPETLDTLLLSLLAKTPQRRPPSAAALRRMLEKLPTTLPATIEAGAPMRNPLDRLASGSFIGRRRELDRLKHALDEAGRGRTRMLLVTGEPGIGKSRIVQELATFAALRGVRVLDGRCHESGGAPAYWPWTQILRRYEEQTGAAATAEDFGHDLEAARRLLASATEGPEHGTASEPEHARFRLFDSLARFLESACNRRPLLVTLDDVHWADSDSLQLLTFLARELCGARLVVVATLRSEEVQADSDLARAIAALRRHGGFESINLTGLPEDEVEALVAAIAGRPSSVLLARHLRERTEGNPFFIQELLRSMAEEGILENPSAAASVILDSRAGRVPEGVRELLERRLARLSGSVTRLLASASVIGREFHTSELAALASVPAQEVLESMEAATAARVVTAVDATTLRWRFTHALVREVLYEGLAPARRMDLHRDRARLLESAGAGEPQLRIEEIAHHYAHCAAAGDADKAVEYLDAAGAHAARRLAFDEASNHYRRALDAWKFRASAAAADRCALMLRLAETLRMAGYAEQSLTTFREAGDLARTLLGDEPGLAPTLLARAALGVDDAWGTSGLLDRETVRRLEEARELLGGDSAIKARLLARLAVAYYWTDRVEERDRLSLEAVEMARRTGDDQALAITLNSRRFAIWSPANLAEQTRISREIIECTRRMGREELAMGGRFWLIIDALAAGDFATASRQIDLYTSYTRKGRQPTYIWYATVARAMRELVVGHVDEAERLAGEALAVGQRAQAPDAEQFFGAQAMQHARLRRTTAMFEAPVAAFVAQFPAIPTWRAVLASILAAAGKIDEARTEVATLTAEGLTDIPRDANLLAAGAMLSEACYLLGDGERAVMAYRLLEPFADQHIVVANAACYFGPVAHFLGLAAVAAGRSEAARAHFADSVARCEASGARPFAMESRLAWARELAAAGDDPERRRELVDQAATAADAMGLVAAVEEARALAPVSPAGASAARAVVRTEALTGRIRNEGEYWSLAFRDRTVRMKHSKGLGYLTELLRMPGREILAADLAGMTRDEHGSVLALDSDTGAVLDDRAKSDYRKRLESLESELAEAEANNDFGRATLLRAELEGIADELTRGLGLGGRDRRSGSAAEKARLNVTRAIRSVLRRLDQEHPEMAAHLDATVRTGTYCSYNPDPALEIRWDLG